MKAIWYCSLPMIVSLCFNAFGQVAMYGKVIDKTTRSGVAGATVFVVELPGRIATTVTDGSFTLQMSPALAVGSKVTLRVMKSGFIASSNLVNVAPVLDKDIELETSQIRQTPRQEKYVNSVEVVTGSVDKFVVGKSLSIAMRGRKKFVLLVGELDITGADAIVRFTDEHGVNRDSVNEAALRRIAGATYDESIRKGIVRFDGTLRPGTAFLAPTDSTNSGQAVCSTFAPSYNSDAPFASVRIASAYDTCFSLATMVTSTLSVAFPGYDSGSGFSAEFVAPIVVDHLVADLEHSSSVMLLTLVVRTEAFPTYLQLLRNKFHLRTQDFH